MPARLAASLSAEQRAELDALQSGLDRLAASQREPELVEDPMQRAADLAQWYLRVALEPAVASTISIDSDRCLFRLGEAAEHGIRPSRRGVAELHRQWLREPRWPCLPGDDEPPILCGLSRNR